jgi:hypothetical protein
MDGNRGVNKPKELKKPVESRYVDYFFVNLSGASLF